MPSVVRGSFVVKFFFFQLEVLEVKSFGRVFFLIQSVVFLVQEAVVACCSSDAALGGPFLAKDNPTCALPSKTRMFALWDLFVRLRKPLLNDDYAARRSICAFSAVGGMWAVRAHRARRAWCCLLRRFDVDLLLGWQIKTQSSHRITAGGKRRV